MEGVRFIPCKICSAPSTGFHFGALTCEACKAFFRRVLKSGATLSTLTCSGADPPPIDPLAPPNGAVYDSVALATGSNLASSSSSSAAAESAAASGSHQQQQQPPSRRCDLAFSPKKCPKCRYQRCLEVGMGPSASKIGRPTKGRVAEVREELHRIRPWLEFKAKKEEGVGVGGTDLSMAGESARASSLLMLANKDASRKRSALFATGPGKKRHPSMPASVYYGASGLSPTTSLQASLASHVRHFSGDIIDSKYQPYLGMNDMEFDDADEEDDCGDVDDEEFFGGGGNNTPGQLLQQQQQRLQQQLQQQTHALLGLPPTGASSSTSASINAAVAFSQQIHGLLRANSNPEGNNNDNNGSKQNPVMAASNNNNNNNMNFKSELIDVCGDGSPLNMASKIVTPPSSLNSPASTPPSTAILTVIQQYNNSGGNRQRFIQSLRDVGADKDGSSLAWLYNSADQWFDIANVMFQSPLAISNLLAATSSPNAASTTTSSVPPSIAAHHPSSSSSHHQPPHQQQPQQPSTSSLSPSSTTTTPMTTDNNNNNNINDPLNIFSRFAAALPLTGFANGGIGNSNGTGGGGVGHNMRPIPSTQQPSASSSASTASPLLSSSAFSPWPHALRSETMARQVVQATKHLASLNLSRQGLRPGSLNLTAPDLWGFLMQNFEANTTHVTNFARSIPGYSMITSVPDRAILSMNSFFPLLFANMSIDFDPISENIRLYWMGGNGNDANGNGNGANGGDDNNDNNNGVTNNRSNLLRNSTDSSDSSSMKTANLTVVEFGFMCALIHFNPGIRGLQDPISVEMVASELMTAAEYFVNNNFPSSNSVTEAARVAFPAAAFLTNGSLGGSGVSVAASRLANLNKLVDYFRNLNASNSWITTEMGTATAAATAAISGATQLNNKNIGSTNGVTTTTTTTSSTPSSVSSPTTTTATTTVADQAGAGNNNNNNSSGNDESTRAIYRKMLELIGSPSMSTSPPTTSDANNNNNNNNLPNGTNGSIDGIPPSHPSHPSHHFNSFLAAASQQQQQQQAYPPFLQLFAPRFGSGIGASGVDRIFCQPPSVSSASHVVNFQRH